MQRRGFLRLGAAALAAPAIARAQSGQRAATLRFVPYADLAVLDPIVTTNYVTRTHALLVFDTLYGMDEQFRVQPQMVAGHTTEDDGRLWRLTLRDGLTFHDGAPVLARDAVASLRRWAPKDSFGSALFAAVDELSAPSDAVVQFRLRHPFPMLPAALAKPVSFLPVIMPERLAATSGATPLTEMVGSGPYRFVPGERVPGARNVYARFDGYRPRPDGVASFTAGPRVAHFERVEWVTIPDGATASAALASGEVDWWEQPNIDLVPQLARNRDLRVEVIETLGLIGMIRFNHLLPPFDNPAICHAILGATDQSAMMDAVAGTDPGIRRGPVGIFTPGEPSANDAGMALLTGPRDLKASRAALAAAGYDGQRVVLLAGTDVPRIDAVCEVMRDTMQQLGMNVDYVSTDWGTVIQRVLSQQPLDQGGWSCYGVFSGGLDLLSPAYHLMSRGIGRAGVPSWLTDPALERGRDDWFAATDDAGRLAACRAIQLEALRVGAYAPCGQYFQPSAYRAGLRDMAHGLPVFTGVRRG